MSVWCVVNTHPNQESRAETNLLRQGFRAWLPAINRTRRHARRVDTVRAPLFPGYLFVNLDLAAGGWSVINHSFGVKRLLADAVAPKPLPAAFIDALRSRLGADGVVDLAPDGLAPGEVVRIGEGPFEGRLAIVSALRPGDRVRLLLDVLGGRVSAEAPRRALRRTEATGG